jgi:hypothetical protein
MMCCRTSLPVDEHREIRQLEASATGNVNATMQKAAPHEELPSVDFSRDKLTRQILQKERGKKRLQTFSRLQSYSWSTYMMGVLPLGAKRAWTEKRQLCV